MKTAKTPRRQEKRERVFFSSSWRLGVLAVHLLLFCGCTSIKPGDPLVRRGDEIVVAGQFFHTGTPVVLWMDPGGYDGYRVERRFAPYDQSSWAATTRETTAIASPNRFNLREKALTAAEIEKARGGGWDLPLLQKSVDQLVFHFDVSGTSRQCFETLQDERGLSVHFMIDLDGTIYQTLDVKERAWHATISNTRSVGVEIANIGAYAPTDRKRLEEWYETDKRGQTRVTIPPKLGDGGIRTPNFTARPARMQLITGVIQGQQLVQYDFTLQQYESLIKLTATLCKVLPNIPCDYPHDSAGRVIPQKLPDEQFNGYRGILGHYHIQQNKIDPGPAFQWDFVVNEARKQMRR